MVLTQSDLAPHTVQGSAENKLFEGNLFLVGPMGAGKTTVGRHLADLLGRAFIDSDHEIELRTGATIPWIFEKEGELGFRLREESVLAELTAMSNIVLATGGGAVTSEQSRRYLHSRGTVIYLYTPVSMQVARTSRDRNRPLLQTSNPEVRLRELLEIRDPLYRSIAHHVVMTLDGSARELAQKIIHLIQRNDIK
ncbi:MAG: shikimate kinase AroK [Candidatus Saccharibacteria bacterium]|nr:shikimate kinase AroK [Moraxellaceae bacterium]